MVSQALPAFAAAVYTPLIASDAAAYSRLGEFLAVSTDGSTTIVGSATRYTGATPTSADRPGAAYIYSGIPAETGLTRTEDAILVADDGMYESLNDWFGSAVALSADGNIAAVGARGYQNGVGAVYMFERSGGVWTKTAKILTPSAKNFGYSVSLSDNGSTLLVGAPGFLYSNSEPSAAYFFTRDASAAWTYRTSVSTGLGGVQLGTSVALNGTGTTAVVGVPKYYTTVSGVRKTQPRAQTYTFNGIAAATQYVYTDPSTDTSSNFGVSIDISSTGAAVLVGAPGVDSSTSGTTTTYRPGAGYLFRSGSNTATMFSATLPSSGHAGAHLGASVGISPDGLTVVLGAPQANLFLEYGGGGTARLWKNTTGTWPTGGGSNVYPGGYNSDQFGISVSVANNGRMAIGAPGKAASGMTSAGTAYVINIS
ncbi:MAG TPA: hypothetical protein VGB75_17765 [Jatrophihabitans sp.]|jgi:hypothetical protein|uniref:hypothetical protein n=1 Tax=Jatrophihabitans sp. TaxID=1932789 RepID=UPI002F216A53